MLLRSDNMTSKVEIVKQCKMEYSDVKLGKYDGNTSVTEWVDKANACVKLRGLKGDMGASFWLYHLEGNAKIEVLMMCKDLTDIESIRSCLDLRFGEVDTKNELVYKIMSRK